MAESEKAEIWEKHIGEKVDFLRPGYVDETWHSGRIIRLSEGSDPFNCVIIIDESENEYSIHFNNACSNIIMIDQDLENDPDYQAFKTAEKTGEFKKGTWLGYRDGELVGEGKNLDEVSEQAGSLIGVYVAQIGVTEEAHLPTSFIEE